MLDYFVRRQQRRLDRRARAAEWDYTAGYQCPRDICFGVGPGWWPILRELHIELLDWDADYRLIEAGERHGGLRVYASFEPGVAPMCDYLVAKAIEQASRTCEVCGEVGALRAERERMKTLCDECWRVDREEAEGSELEAEIALERRLSPEPDFPAEETVGEWLEVAPYDEEWMLALVRGTGHTGQPR